MAATSAAQPVQLETDCVYCGQDLQYPETAQFVQCPTCEQVMSPLTPLLHYVSCAVCKTLLSHPAHAPSIRCPKCTAVMDVSARYVHHRSSSSHSDGLTYSQDRPRIMPVTNNKRKASSNSWAEMSRSQVQDDEDEAAAAAAAGAVPPQPPPEEEQKKKKEKRVKKDPNFPKRAKNAYMVFCTLERPNLKDKHPDWSFGQLGAKLGDIWRQMETDAKAPYEERAKQDRQRFKQELADYTARYGAEAAAAEAEKMHPNKKRKTEKARKAAAAKKKAAKAAAAAAAAAAKKK
jgi:LSD1 subclass zinc finger protein